jgi:predicted SAM-dependent methyltransferase
LIRLDIGAGPYGDTPEGWITVDAFVDADVKAFMWDLPYGDGEVDEIHCSHALEHITKYEVRKTLNEWRRVLKPGGQVDIKVPDLRWVCKNWLEKQDSDWALDAIYGMHNHPGEQHKTGFSPVMLKGYPRRAF